MRRGLKRAASDATSAGGLDPDSDTHELGVEPPIAEIVFSWAHRARRCLAVAPLGDSP